jgi:acyl-CoA hydrolase
MRTSRERPRAAVRSGSEVHLDEWVAPEVADELGYLQAGKILEWMDVAGALAATRHCRRAVVTASIDGMELHTPIRLGERVAMTARVAYTSKHSVGVSVTMTHGTGTAGAPTPSLEAYMTFVPVDRRGRIAPVPQFVPETPAERARFREGELRREFRRRSKDTRLALASDPIQLVEGELADKDWPVVIREWMTRLPRYLRMPWERSDPRRPRARGGSYMHKIEPVRVGSMNFHGTLYGGTLMRWAEVSANLSARAYVHGVAIRCTGLHGLCFTRPVERDRFAHLRSVVVHTSEQSLTSLVSVQSEDPTTGKYAENLRAFFTYGPLDGEERIPALDCQSDEERALFTEVEKRMELQRRLAAAESNAA